MRPKLKSILERTTIALTTGSSHTLKKEQEAHVQNNAAVNREQQIKKPATSNFLFTLKNLVHRIKQYASKTITQVEDNNPWCIHKLYS